MRKTSLFALLLAPAAFAAEVRVDGSYRLRAHSENDFPLDDEPFRLGQEKWLEHRLRLTPKIVEEGQIEVQASFDILSGLIAGDLAPDFRGLGWTGRSERAGIRASGFEFRHLFAQLRLPQGLLAFGQMPNQWGMGMLMNSGNGEDETDFGDARFGDIVDRILFATRPFSFLGPRSGLAQHVTFAIGGDLVYRDRYAQLLVRNGGGLQWGDVAWQIVSALVWDPSETSRAGLYVTRRIQTYAANGGDLHVWTFDAHARTSRVVPWLGNSVVTLEAEFAQVYGGTSHAPNLAAPGTTRVNQQGAAGRARLAHGAVEGELEGGYASGDSNPFDDQSTAFQMNRDFKVGLVLFDEVLLFQSQNAARRLSEPNLFGAPPPGLDLLPTQGAVTNAIYVRPTVRYRPPGFGGRLRLIASALFARAPQPVIDPYQALVTSTAANSFGRAAGRNYGVELDAAIGYRTRLAGAWGFEAGIQAGHLFPGDAFTRADGSRMGGVSTVQLRGTVTF